MMFIKLLRDLTLNLPEPEFHKKGEVVEVPDWKGDALVNQRGCAKIAQPPEEKPKPKAKAKAVKKPVEDKMVKKDQTEDK